MSDSGPVSEGVLCNAADALADLADELTARDEIVEAGGIVLLVRLLRGDGLKARQFVALALARLSKEHEATQLAIAAAGAIPRLVALLDGKEGARTYDP